MNCICIRLVQLVCTFCLLISTAHGQLENNQWRFGYAAGIDFNGPSPVQVFDGVSATQEGSASIANPTTGQLMFYTDGVTVWNAQNNPMPNGTGLRGGVTQLSSTTAAVIIPRPGSASQYYVVCIDEQFSNNGITYSLVDMSLAGGLGDVVASEKNIPLYQTTSEKLCVVPNAAGDGYWLISHDMSADSYIAFSVNASGIANTPVVSTVGDSHGNGSGHLKISRDFTKMAVGNLFSNAIELFSFNNSSGQFQSLFSVPFSFGTSTFYGVEFSPNSQLLYISNLTSVVQYDLSSLTATDVEASAYVVIDYGFFSQPASLQLGPDDRIYIASSTVDVINCPNFADAACGFQQTPIPGLSSGSYGLPGWIYSLATPEPLVEEILINGNCTEQSVGFSFVTDETFTELIWDFGDGSATQSTTDTEVTHVYNTPGNYTVVVQLVQNCGTLEYTETWEIVACTEEPTVTIAGNGNVCILPANITFAPSVENGTVTQIVWDFGDGSDAVTLSPNSNTQPVEHSFTEEGNFDVCATVTFDTGDEVQVCIAFEVGNCCTFSFSNTLECAQENSIFRLNTNAEIQQLVWSIDGQAVLTSETNVPLSFVFSQPGVYQVEASVQSNCGSDVLAAEVTIAECESTDNFIYVPNTFTPNGDGLNEVFQPTIFGSFSNYQFFIYNRWGQRVFETDEYGKPWLGGADAYYVADGTYYYQVTYTDARGVGVVRTGHVTILR
jgi:gliding motility-associated-like protein